MVVGTSSKMSAKKNSVFSLLTHLVGITNPNANMWLTHMTLHWKIKTGSFEFLCEQTMAMQPDFLSLAVFIPTDSFAPGIRWGRGVSRVQETWSQIGTCFLFLNQGERVLLRSRGRNTKTQSGLFFRPSPQVPA